MFEVDLKKLKKELESKFPNCIVTGDGFMITLKTEQITKIQEEAITRGCTVDSIIAWHTSVINDSLPDVKRNSELLIAYQIYTSYLLSCALSGEHNPQSFEVFNAR